MLEVPIAPMLAKPTDQIPEGDYFYEPKWDGFRAIVSVGAQVRIDSRDQKELTRYFPELVTAFKNQISDGVILDGEIVVPGSKGLDFSALQQRIHPAESRVQLLSRETPAAFIAFDLLQQGEPLINQPFEVRRTQLAKIRLDPPLYRTASTTSYAQATEWFSKFLGSGVDGIVAKPAQGNYQPDVRAMQKIKHFYSADCVVAGLRPLKSNPQALGALLLGLYDHDRILQYVGSTSSFRQAARVEIAQLLAPLATQEHPWLSPVNGQRAPGALSRWSGKKNLSFTPLEPVVVCEVRYDQLEGQRFRHAATFLRWRPDRTPHSCTFEQLRTSEGLDLAPLIGA